MPLAEWNLEGAPKAIVARMRADLDVVAGPGARALDSRVEGKAGDLHFTVRLEVLYLTRTS